MRRRVKQLKGFPKFHIDRERTMQKAQDHGCLPIQKNENDFFTYVIDKDKKVIVAFTASKGYVIVPVSEIDRLTDDLKDIRDTFFSR